MRRIGQRLGTLQEQPFQMAPHRVQCMAEVGQHRRPTVRSRNASSLWLANSRDSAASVKWAYSSWRTSRSLRPRNCSTTSIVLLILYNPCENLPGVVGGKRPPPRPRLATSRLPFLKDLDWRYPSSVISSWRRTKLERMPERSLDS